MSRRGIAGRADQVRAGILAAFVIPRQCSRKLLRDLALRYQHHECRNDLFFPPGAFVILVTLPVPGDAKRRVRLPGRGRAS